MEREEEEEGEKKMGKREEIEAGKKGNSGKRREKRGDK